MAKLKRCDLCGAEADELMSIEFPFEERWMLFFHKKSFAHYADICLDCLKEIRATRQEKIRLSEVSFEIADTPQTEEQRKVQEAEHRMANIIANMDTPQTDCAWREPNEADT